MRRRTVFYLLLGFTTALLIVVLATEIQTGSANPTAWMQAQRHMPLLQMLDFDCAFLFVVIGLYGQTVSRVQAEMQQQSEDFSDQKEALLHRSQERVSRMPGADLPTKETALRAAGTPPTNLPVPGTFFVGREAEIAELKRTLAGSPILTLIGSEGIGKSRLAVRLASDLRNAFPAGVWLAELPSITDVDIVPGTVAWALSAQATGPGTSLTEALVALLHDRKALLVLDAGESNLEACAHLVTALAGPCPDVKFVVCARKGLGLRDEAVYCVPALESSGMEGGSEAEQLCRDRAAQLPIPLDLDGPLLTELCFLLDGVPLTLELVLGTLASKREDSLGGLTRSIRDLTEGRQHSREETLQFVLDWSYQRLSETERVVLERLSVFQSGWSLEAATSVCCDALLPSSLLPAVLESLRTRAFVAAEQRSGFTRESLGNAVRNYAEACLTRRGEAAEFRRRHAEYFMRLAEQGTLDWTGRDQEDGKAFLKCEYINCRVALRFLRQDAGGDTQELRLATALLSMFECSGRPEEGISLLSRATEAHRAPASHSDDYPAALSHFFTAIKGCRTAGDRPTEAQHLNSLAHLALSQGDFATAMRSYEQAVEVFREMGDQTQETRALHHLGSAACDGGKYVIARNHYERALEINRSLGRRKDEAHDLNALAQLALMQGNAAEAAGRFQESLVLFRELGERGWEAYNMGQILRMSLPTEPLWERSRMHDGAKN